MAMTWQMEYGNDKWHWYEIITHNTNELQFTSEGTIGHLLLWNQAYASRANGLLLNAELGLNTMSSAAVVAIHEAGAVGKDLQLYFVQVSSRTMFSKFA
jgi:hypothetical protein